MSHVQIYRIHALGLAQARRVASQWSDDARLRFDMSCVVSTGPQSDTIEFSCVGAKGLLVVAADHFKLDAKLGFLLQAFGHTIEAEIAKNLDDLLSLHGAGT